LRALHQAYSQEHRAETYAKDWGSPKVFYFLNQPLPGPASYGLIKERDLDQEPYFSIFIHHDEEDGMSSLPTPLTFLGSNDHRWIQKTYPVWEQRHADDMRHAIRMLLTAPPHEPWAHYGNAQNSPLRKNLTIIQQALGNDTHAVPEDLASLVRCLPTLMEALPAYEQAIANQTDASFNTNSCGLWSHVIAIFAQTPCDNARDQTAQEAWKTEIEPQLVSLFSGYPFTSSIADSDPVALNQMLRDVAQWETSHPKSNEEHVFRQRLHALRKAIFPGGSLGIALTFRPVSSSQYGEISLGDGNIMHTYRGGPERWMQWHWRTGTPAVLVAKGRNQQSLRIEGMGPWSLLRLMDRGHVSSANDGIRITWQNISIDFQVPESSQNASRATHFWRTLFARVKKAEAS
jgi:hypothetical protein